MGEPKVSDPCFLAISGWENSPINQGSESLDVREATTTENPFSLGWTHGSARSSMQPVTSGDISQSSDSIHFPSQAGGTRLASCQPAYSTNGKKGSRQRAQGISPCAPVEAPKCSHASPCGARAAKEKSVKSNPCVSDAWIVRCAPILEMPYGPLNLTASAFF